MVATDTSDRQINEKELDAGQQGIPGGKGLTCIFCGGSLREGDAFCMKCGKAVSAGGIPEPEPAPVLSYCPECGSPLKREYLFCASCGYPVRTHHQEPSPDGPEDEGPMPVDKEPAVCPKCFTVLEEGDSFCPECGAPVGIPDNSAYGRKGGNKKRFRSPVAVLFLAVIFASVLILFLKSPVRSLVKALDSEDYVSSVEIYNEEVTDNPVWKWIADRLLERYMDSFVSEYESGNLNPEDVIAGLEVLSTIENENIAASMETFYQEYLEEIELPYQEEAQSDITVAQEDGTDIEWTGNYSYPEENRDTGQEEAAEESTGSSAPADNGGYRLNAEALLGSWKQETESGYYIMVTLRANGELIYNSPYGYGDYTGTYTVEDELLWLNLVNADAVSTTPVPYEAEILYDQEKDTLSLSLADGRETEDFSPLDGMEQVIEGTYKRMSFTEEELDALKEAFNVPDELDVTVEQGIPYYWDAGEVWVISVDFYENGEYIAGATCEVETGAMSRNIMMYSGS